MNKIKFKDVAHMYLGCKIQTAEGIGTFNALHTGDDDEPITSYDLVKAHLNFDEVKPILRSYESLPDYDFRAKYPQFISVKEADRQYILMFYMATREGFDMFGLIDNGEAIDAATLGEEVQG